MTTTKSNLPRWHQTDITDSGNCMMTCFANYFGIPESELPPIHAMYSCKHPESFWLDVLELWLSKMGYNLLYTLNHKQAREQAGKDFYFVIGSSINDIDHMVIFRNGRLYFDPYIGGNGVKKDKTRWFLVVTRKRTEAITDNPYNHHHERFKIKP